VSVTFAHVGGVPLEETLGMYGPALVVVLGAASARVGARLRRLRGGRGSDRCRGGSGSDRAACESRRGV
jgi:hypothetical protein